jgi:carbamoyl-phosphate synthase large subunit
MARSSLSILICSAGRRVGLVQAFRAAADRLSLDLTVLACDLDPDHSAACAVAAHAFKVPRCDDPGYVDAIKDIVRKFNVALVVPTIDPELLPLAQSVEDFRALGARVHISDLSVIEIARDKARTSRVFADAGVPVPRTMDEAQLWADPTALTWPVFAKPSGGSASRGLAVYHDVKDVPDQFDEPMIFQDTLEGPEYTINMFVDQSGALKCVVPHIRLSIRAGEVEKGRTERREDLKEIAQGIARALPGLRGVACFQILDDPRFGPRVIEINARFGGGYPLADHAGATFAQWLLEELCDLPSTANDDWRDGVLMMRYDSAVYQG